MELLGKTPNNLRQFMAIFNKTQYNDAYTAEYETNILGELIIVIKKLDKNSAYYFGGTILRHVDSMAGELHLLTFAEVVNNELVLKIQKY